jgi:hypothetical protein
MKKLGYKITLLLVVGSSVSFNAFSQESLQRPPLKQGQGGVKKPPQLITKAVNGVLLFNNR